MVANRESLFSVTSKLQSLPGTVEIYLDRDRLRQANAGSLVEPPIETLSFDSDAIFQAPSGCVCQPSHLLFIDLTNSSRASADVRWDRVQCWLDTLEPCQAESLAHEIHRRKARLA